MGHYCHRWEHVINVLQSNVDIDFELCDLKCGGATTEPCENKTSQYYFLSDRQGSELHTSLSIGVSVDFADQEATLVELAIGLLGGTSQWVSSAAQALHGVGGGVCSGVSQLRHGLPQLLLITAKTVHWLPTIASAGVEGVLQANWLAC